MASWPCLSLTVETKDAELAGHLESKEAELQRMKDTLKNQEKETQSRLLKLRMEVKPAKSDAIRLNQTVTHGDACKYVVALKLKKRDAQLLLAQCT